MALTLGKDFEAAILSDSGGQAAPTCVDADAQSHNVIVWTYKKRQNQQFRFKSAGDGCYFIQVKSNGKVLDIDNSTADGSPIIQWDFRGNDNQKFRLVKTGSGSLYAITANYSGMALGVGDGGKIVQQAAPNKKWMLSPLVFDVAIIAEHSGQALDVNPQPPHNVRVSVYQGYPHQSFRLEDAGQGFYYIHIMCSGKYLDVDGASQGDGTPVVQWRLTGKDNQKFRLEQRSGGHAIIAKHSAKALTTSGPPAYQIYQASLDMNSREQIWELQALEVGSPRPPLPGIGQEPLAAPLPDPGTLVCLSFVNLAGETLGQRTLKRSDLDAEAAMVLSKVYQELGISNSSKCVLNGKVLNKGLPLLAQLTPSGERASFTLTVVQMNPFEQLSQDMEEIAPFLPDLPNGYRGSQNNVVWHGLRKACKRYSENSGDADEMIEVFISAGPGGGCGHGCEVRVKIRDIFKRNLNAKESREQSIAAIFEAEKDSCENWKDQDVWERALGIMARALELLKETV